LKIETESFKLIPNNRQNYSSVHRGMELPSNPKLTGGKQVNLDLLFIYEVVG